ncbi:hypothetical protein WJX84_009562 [Apatococcus fuscideae]|uniref:Vacuolar sorting receptor thioredoxin-like domain-containing protein n=1 Tax=Apatococcus fuscideae TaxID=2026836 RepID=A0AAW1SEE1_9CHLO
MPLVWCQVQVDWEFWTNSNDQCGTVCDSQRDFIREFAPVAKELEGNWTRFTPHYIVWVCPRAYRSSPECESQCIHHGRYCTPDPDGDLDNGYKGKDVVQENLRQLCVYKLANESGRPWVWWEYTTRFSDECKMSDNNYNEECAERVFSELAGDDWSNKDALRSCIGDINADTNNAMMQMEMQSQRGSSQEGEVFILPTVRINHGQYRGKLAYSEVLKAICAGFTKNAEPDVCMRVSEDDCREGSVGDRECKARTDGKTQCKNNFSGYNCECGRGFLPHTDSDGHETCLNVNECTSVDKATLDPACTCERCACKDTYGSYECISDIPDDCATENECWTGSFKVAGKQQTFSACQDSLETIQDKASKGESVSGMANHTCACGACFTQYEENGKMECVPKCNLAYCDQDTGICNEPPPKSGAPVWAVLSIVFGSFLLVGLIGYAVYRYRLRGEMHQEIRDIMAQYMPLENQSGVEVHGSGV